MVNKYYVRYFLFIILTGLLFACSSEGDEIIKPEIPEEIPGSYFLRTTKSVSLDKYGFIERMGESRDNPLVNLLPSTKMKVDAILYKLTAPDGKAIEASGIIAYPESGAIKGVVLGEHFTITADRESPSSVMATFESALALFGYAVIVPDHIGFGSTANLPQTYIHKESSGRASVNMVLAAKEYLKTINKEIGDNITVVGYSQGGYSALAFTEMAEEEFVDEIKIDAVYAGGGPYEPAAMLDLYIEKNYAYYPCVVPLTILGFNYADNLNMDMSKLFARSLLSSYQDLFFSKSYTMGEINKKIGTNTISSFMHPDFLSGKKSEEMELLNNSLRQNSLLTRAPKAPVTLIHGKKDWLVPHVNAELAYEAFTKAGTDVKLIPVEADHHETAVTFYMTVLLAFQ